MKGRIMDALKKSPRIHVLGIAGQEGRAVFDFFLKEGIKTIGHENTPESDFKSRFLSYSDAYSKEEAEDMADRFINSGSDIHFSDRYLSDVEKGDAVIVPQAYRRYPINKSLISMAESGDIALFQAIELAFDIAPCITIGVTGTAGKSTTASLIEKIISSSGKKLYFSGNDREDKWDFNELKKIGPDGFALFEISHRHLIDLKSSPDIAVITNIYPHHLDDAGSFEKYMDLKKNIIRYQKEGDRAVVNYSLIESGAIKTEDTAAEIFSFGGPEGVSPVFIKDGNILMDGGKQKIISIEELPFRGEHNIQNALAATTAVSSIFSADDIRRGLLSWKPLKYRQEVIWSDGERSVINDGKSSDPLATIEAVRAVPDISVLVIGGVREGMKSGDFVPLAEEIAKSSVKTIIIYGRSKDEIGADFASITERDIKVFSFDSYKDAFQKAFESHKSGSLVFSPACQSFDGFRDFRERGEAWNAAVATQYKG
ncbi:MAG: Mur ligase family protein [Candidatus Colwellbacteria bacterium]|nr:Mur ligase family protein [Candidatus Colwellbacteria bacterium]